MSSDPPDSDEKKQAKLKEIVADLHEGSDISSVRKKFAALIKDVTPQEIAHMEQALISEGVPVEQVQKVCDVHVQVFQKALEKQKKTKALPGHPVHTYLEENKALRRILRKLKRLLSSVAKGKSGDEFEKALGQLKEIEIHYQRKENQLFPALENVDFTGPSKVMWGKHDEIRSRIKELESAYQKRDWRSLLSGGKTAVRAAKRMIFMEERILFPTALRKLSDQEWAEMRRGEPEIGYAWIKPGNLWDPSVAVSRVDAAGDTTQKDQTNERSASAASRNTEKQREGSPEIPLDVGRLTGGQINLLLKNLPVDITYVDADDRVRYYSQGKERIFPRSPAVIGRAVQNCHPPKSVHVVEKILESFRKKEKDAAEFWITINERFIHIRYFALYKESGDYSGVIEVSQDVTDIRSLSGEKRLLDW
jgi:DUF438 domain-containing protein